MDSTTCRDLCERWENDYIANKNMLAFGNMILIMTIILIL